MLRKLTLLAIGAFICITPNLALAQNGLPRANKKGDYYNGDWREWLVVDRDRKGLNCRSGAGANFRVVTKFYNNSRIFVFTQGEDDLIRRDKQGKPWLAVLPNGYQYEEPCFVRANNSFIQPIPRD
jgi:hypothetical protein